MSEYQYDSFYEMWFFDYDSFMKLDEKIKDEFYSKLTDKP